MRGEAGDDDRYVAQGGHVYAALELRLGLMFWFGLGFGFGLGLGLELGIGLGLGLVLGIGLGLGLAPGRCSCVATQLGTAIRGWRCSRRALRLG